jgi:hypothetical protein
VHNLPARAPSSSESVTTQSSVSPSGSLAGEPILAILEGGPPMDGLSATQGAIGSVPCESVSMDTSEPSVVSSTPQPGAITGTLSASSPTCRGVANPIARPRLVPYWSMGCTNPSSDPPWTLVAGGALCEAAFRAPDWPVLSFMH